MKKIFFFLAATLFAIHSYAQQPVSGVVHDGETGEAIVGAVVIVGDGKVHTETDVDGKYTLNLADGKYLLDVRFPGFNCDSVFITVAGKPLTVDFICHNSTLKEIEVVADVAVDRKTPVAFANVNEMKLREESAGRDLPIILNTTPGVYATEQGGGSGDSRVNIRGVDQRNVSVMVDGVPMNDMENGQVYWSNWSGLGDVTRTMQVQRGLGASRLAIPSVGGTINVLTRGIDQKQSFTFRTDYSSVNMRKFGFGFNSGEIGKGWGVTMAGSNRKGDGLVDQTWTNEWSYFLKVQKRFDKHLFSLSLNGSAQSHGQRYSRMPVAVLNRAYAEKLGINVDSTYAAGGNGFTTAYQGERGRYFNPDWGFINYADGTQERVSQDVNFFNKPLINFSWFWIPNEKFTLSTVTYLSIGKGGGTNFNSTPNRDTTTGQLNLTQSYRSNTSNIDALYSTTEHKSTRELLASMNNHFWVGALSTATWTPNNKWTYLFGLDVRHYKGSHFRQAYDLLGGDYFIDGNNRNQPNGVGNLEYAMKRKGDKVGYYNESFVDWAGIFAQAEYSGARWSAFGTITTSATQYQRVDYFKKRDIILDDGTEVPMIVGYNEVYYTNGSQSAVAQNNAVITIAGDTTKINNPTGPDYAIVNAKSYSWDSDAARTATTNKKIFPGFTIKTGANYNLNENYNVFMNVGYMNLAPRFNTVLDNNNHEIPGVRQQQIYAVELGIGARFPRLAANVNGYYTNWKNKPPQSLSYTNANGSYTYEMTGLNTLLMGVEFDGMYKLNKKFSFEGLFSLGSWKYQSSGVAYLYDNATLLLEDTIYYSAKNIHLGNAAQTQFGASVRWMPFKGFYVKPRYTYFGRNYANFDPINLSEVKNGAGTVVEDNRNHDSWKMPSYGIFDLHAGYDFKLFKEKKRYIVVGFNGSITNLLNTVYISDGQNGGDFDASTAQVFMGLGRRYNIGMRITF
ncbi:MAG: carboxypeptidase-like regulatory domain-containing protein [Bacteroidia bacterium]